MESLLQLLKDPAHQAEHKQQMNALDEVNRYLTIAAHQHSMQQEMASKADSADFLRKHSKLNPTSPTFENDVAQLFAEHPRSQGQAITDALSASRATRNTYLNAVAPGGADEFATGSPEQHAYLTRYRQTQDPVAARAHAINTSKGEEMIRTSIANGLIDPSKDFPDWDGTDAKRPKLYNPDGTMNYHEFGLLAAQRAGEISGKATAAEDKSVTDARNLLNAIGSNPTLLPDGPEGEELKATLFKRIYDHEMNRNKAKPTASPTGATATAPNADASAFVP